MKEAKVLNELISELSVLEKKKEKILQEVEELKKKNPNKVRPEEIRSLIKRIVKLIDNFKSKLRVIEKMTSRI